MSNSVRYFQVTPDILLEYIYTKDTSEQTGDISDVLVDLQGKGVINILDNALDNVRYLYFDETKAVNPTNINANHKNFVLAMSKNRNRFIKYYNDDNDRYEDNENYLIGKEIEKGEYDVVFDKIRLHFTSRNFFGDYDSLIFDAYIYKSDKSKISLMSFVLSRMDNNILDPNPLLINQKLYTSYRDYKIVSTNNLLVNKNKILEYIIPENSGRLLKNTPIMFEVHGVNNTIDMRGYDVYKTEQISCINIPCVDSYDNVFVKISEANDGDYFIIKPEVSDGRSFSEFISEIDENVESYVILHELSLTEYYVDERNTVRSETTHREHFVLNATTDVNGETDVNTSALNDDFIYRPICKHGSKCIYFNIDDILRIVNTKNNSTILKKGSLSYDKPYKYGKYLHKIYVGEHPVNVNVYNKRSNLTDNDEDYIKISNTSARIKAEVGQITTNTINVTSFCETTNIRISVTQ